MVSIFVNPLQFGAGEDLDRYPRTFDEDLKICEREGVDVVFAPDVDEVYPGGEPQVTVDPGPLADVLEGRIRPGHFRGVLTVVAKLFGLVRPDVAVFGQKDYQQLVLIRRMVADLCLGVDVVGAETQREPDGLALSSRNRYLDTEQRFRATALSRTLFARAGRRRAGAATSPSTPPGPSSAPPTGWTSTTSSSPTPTSATSPADVPPGTEARILIAARVGGTRLIDNMQITLGSRPEARTGDG